MPPRNYREYFSFLLHGSGIWAMLAGMAAAVLLKSLAGSWHWMDLGIIGGMVCFRGIIEWLIHYYLYHGHKVPGLPFAFRGSVVDAHVAHHQRPHDLDTLLITWRGVVILLVGTQFLGTLVTNSISLGASFTIGLALVGLFTESLHLLCHSKIPHRSRVLARLVRLHRKHHFEDGDNYFGVSSSLGDKLFGTWQDH